MAVIDAVNDTLLRYLTSSGYTQLVKDEALYTMYMSYNGGVSRINVATDTVNFITGIAGNLFTSISVNPVTHELFVSNWSQNDDAFYVVDGTTFAVSTVPNLAGFSVGVNWIENKAYISYCKSAGFEGFCIYDRKTGAIRRAGSTRWGRARSQGRRSCSCSTTTPRGRTSSRRTLSRRMAYWPCSRASGSSTPAWASCSRARNDAIGGSTCRPSVDCAHRGRCIGYAAAPAVWMFLPAARLGGSMRSRVKVLVALLVVLAARPAAGAFHFMLVVEVYPGHPSSPNAQYVELQMYEAGQNFVSGHSLAVYDASNALVGTFTFGSHVPNGANQATILIATAEAQTLFGVTADLTITAVIPAAGGKVCFTGSGDCVAWGNYNGLSTGVGTPFSPAGLTLGQAMQRMTSGGSNSFGLDPGDDTNDSANDFRSALPTPRNNAGTTGVNPQHVLSINDVRTTEGNAGTSALIFTVMLSEPSLQSVTVDYFSSDGTAGAASDYTLPPGSLSYAPGQTAKTITAQLAGDTEIEADETFMVSLQNASNATIGKGTGTGTIVNDDGPLGVTLSVDDRSVQEGAAVNAAFRLSLSAPTSQTVTVQYAIADGTALAGSDYTQSSGTVTFTPGRTNQSIFVPIVSDSISEGDETFFVNLSNASNAIIADGQAVGTIQDPPTAAKIAMYRSYNRSTDYHFFTTDLASKNFAVTVLGFQDESNPPPFYVSNVLLPGTVPLFRMYNPNLGRHFYTASTGSRDFLMGIGAVYEKEEGFVYPLSTSPQPSGTTELFLLYNNSSGTHLFTADVNQKTGILNLFKGVWVQHTSVGFVFTSP